MSLLPSFLRRGRHKPVLLGAAMAGLLACWGAAAQGEARQIKLLRIGSTGTLGSGRSPSEKTAALTTLKQFIKDETGFDNEIVPEKDWQTLATQLASGKVQAGAFQGYEFAWAKQRYPALKPLALAVNGETYPVVYMVVRKDDKAKNFAGLQGKSIAMLGHGRGALARRFVDQQCAANNKQLKTFFARIVSKDNAEDILDDVVDGTEQAAAVQRAALEAYKRRKPGRFNQLKEIAKSPAVLPPVIAAYDNNLDQAMTTRFRDGLLSANRKEKGQVLLTLFRLTGFEAIPASFDTKLAETQKAFPPPSAAK